VRFGIQSTPARFEVFPRYFLPPWRRCSCREPPPFLSRRTHLYIVSWLTEIPWSFRRPEICSGLQSSRNLSNTRVFTSPFIFFGIPLADDLLRDEISCADALLYTPNVEFLAISRDIVDALKPVFSAMLRRDMPIDNIASMLHLSTWVV
jgi:hypothetical protein